MASLPEPVVASAYRILVIEDNASDVFLLERALKKQNLQFELIHVRDGGEALAFVRRQGAYAKAPIPDLILMDLNLSRTSCRRFGQRNASPRFRSACGVLLNPGETSHYSRALESPNSSPSLPVWINSWRSARLSRICSRALQPVEAGCAPLPPSPRQVETALKFK
jgi:CheY-like chemotaxis protein